MCVSSSICVGSCKVYITRSCNNTELHKDSTGYSEGSVFTAGGDLLWIMCLVKTNTGAITFRNCSDTSSTTQYNDMYQGMSKCPVKWEAYMCDGVNSRLSPGALKSHLLGFTFTSTGMKAHEAVQCSRWPNMSGRIMLYS